MRIIPLIAAAALVLPARAQEHARQETHISRTHNNHRLELRATGDVTFTDAGDWVRSVSPGARLVLEERSGRMDRRAEFTPGSGGALLRYWEDGVARPVDAAARAWVRAAILGLVREGGYGAESRVRSIRAARGAAGVLGEIAALRSDSGRRAWYLALLKSGPLTAAEFARVTEDAADRIGSDSELRMVLSEAIEHAPDAARMRAVYLATGALQSDTETRLVLTRGLEKRSLHPDASAAFFQSVETLDSDLERRLVLSRVLETGLPVAARGDFFRSVEGIDSDLERRLVLTRALEGQGAGVAVPALRAALSMDSDLEKRLVLSAVPAASLRTAPVSAAYQTVLRTMSSDVERSLALRQLAAEQ